MSLLPHAEFYLQCPLFALACNAITNPPTVEDFVYKRPASGGLAAYVNSFLGALGALFNAKLTSHSCRHSGVGMATAHFQVMIHWVIQKGDWTLDALNTFFEYLGFSSKADIYVSRVLSGYAEIDRGMKFANHLGGILPSFESVGCQGLRAAFQTMSTSFFPERIDAVRASPGVQAVAVSGLDRVVAMNLFAVLIMYLNDVHKDCPGHHILITMERRILSLLDIPNEPDYTWQDILRASSVYNSTLTLSGDEGRISYG